MHSIGKMIRTSVLKFAEIGVFECKIRMYANSGKKGRFKNQNVRKLEDRGHIYYNKSVSLVVHDWLYSNAYHLNYSVGVLKDYTF